MLDTKLCVFIDEKNENLGRCTNNYLKKKTSFLYATVGLSDNHTYSNLIDWRIRFTNKELHKITETTSFEDVPVEQQVRWEAHGQLEEKIMTQSIPQFLKQKKVSKEAFIHIGKSDNSNWI